jgi:hypothetical protein
MYKACFEGDISKIDTLIKLGTNKWELGYKGACMSGNLETVKYVLSKIPDNHRTSIRVIRNALESGYMNIINYVIIMYGNDIPAKLFCACKSGNMDLVQMMISAGEHDWNDGLAGACFGGHLDLVDLMINLGASDWDRGLVCAYMGGHEDLVDLMYSKGAEDFDSILFYACLGGNMNLIKKLIDKGYTDWKHGLYGACQGGHLDIVKFILTKTKKRGTLNTAIKYALNNEHYEIGLLLLHEGAYYNGYDKVFNAYLEYMLKKDLNKVAKRHSVGTWFATEVADMLGKPKINGH